MRELWKGPLCVVAREGIPLGEREAIRKEVEPTLDELGVYWLSSSTENRTSLVELEILADPGGQTQAMLDERHGQGIVLLIPVLEPVE